MKSIEKTLKYYELLMSYNKTKDYPIHNLPAKYHYEFYKPGFESDWVDIHLSSGEFTSSKQALTYFHDYYDSFIKELPRRCFFIVTDSGEKVATATVSLTSEDDFTATLDWLAIKQEYQGLGLAKPLISKTISLAYSLGHEKLLLHTQTHTWLAAKLYLDLGFKPYKMSNENIGWRILKTITDHNLLVDLLPLKESEIFDEEALAIINKLEKTHQNFTYEIWNKDGRNDLYVREKNIYYQYKYVFEKKKLTLTLINSEKD